jgi:hypothetical protein
MDKRQHKRFIKRCNVEFVANDITYRGISSNFSLKGFFIRTNYPSTPDTILHIVIHLPDGSISKVTGKVIWALKTSIGSVIGTPIKTLKNGMGIEIIEKDTNYLHLIKLLHDFNQK